MENNYITWVDLSLRSGPGVGAASVNGVDAKRIGLRLTVKAAPQVEEYFGQLSRGRKNPVDAVSDLWHNVGSDSPLEYYVIDEKIRTPQYNLNAVGQPLVSTRNVDPNVPQRLRPVDLLGDNGSGGLGEGVINISFLTLYGISKENGVTIGMTGVYSGAYIKNLQRTLMQAVEQFLRDYLVPVTINMQIVSRPF